MSPTGTPTGAPVNSRAQSGAYLTTAQGLRLSDTDHSLKAGRRGPGAAPGPPPAGENHPLRPRAHPGARGARPRRRRARRLPVLRVGVEHHPRRVPGQRRRDARLRPLLHRPGLPRFGGHRPGHPRLRHEVLHRRGHVRPGRQQHPGLLHPGRHQVPGHHPRRKAASGPRNPAGPERPRHLLGLRFAAHRGPGPHHVEHVRPGTPALLPHDGRLRRPHLPARSTARARPAW